MSVALLDQGEIVPGRGIAMQSGGASSVGGAPSLSNSCRRASAAAVRGPARSKKYANQARKPRAAGATRATSASFFSSRNGEKASPPRRILIRYG